MITVLCVIVEAGRSGATIRSLQGDSDMKGRRQIYAAVQVKAAPKGGHVFRQGSTVVHKVGLLKMAPTVTLVSFILT